MRKVVLILAVLAILPTMAFAQLAVGPAAFLKSPVLLGQTVDVEQLNVNQFSLGGDVRYRIGWFQVEGLVLYSLGEVNSLDVFLDAGVALDVSIVSLSIGAGPNFTNHLGQSAPTRAGYNAKVGADVRLGPVSVGASYIMALRLNDDFRMNVDASSGLLGLQVLFWQR